MAEEEWYIPKPPPENFKAFRENKEDRYLAPNTRVFIIERVEYPEVREGSGLNPYCKECKARFPEGSGILIHRKGQSFPTKGFPFAEACWANDVMKRFLVGFVRTLASPIVLPSALLFLFLPKKRKIAIIEKFLTQFCRTTSFIIEPYVLKDNFWTPMAGEIKKWTYLFLINLGISPAVAEEASLIPCYFIEYDDAYRLREEDMFSESNSADMWLNPRKEIKRIFKIAMRREEQQGEEIKKKMQAIVSILSLVLLSPWMKRAFRKSLDGIDYRNLRLDETDRYACLIWGAGYNFFDKTHPERLEMLAREYGGKVPDAVYIQ